MADRKFYIIYDAFNLNSSPQNIFLKTLEESSNFITFFQITKNNSAILDTIKSRCIKLVDIDDYLSIKELNEYSYFDDAIDLKYNLHYKNITDIANFLNNVVEKDKNSIENIIHIFIYFIKDVIIYKKTYDEKYLSLKNKKVEITLSTHYNYEFLGGFLDDLYDIIPYLNNNVTNSSFSYNILSEKDKSFILYDLLIDKKRSCNMVIVKWIGVRFRPVGKIYFFKKDDYEFVVNEHVIVETIRGIEYATVIKVTIDVDEEKMKSPLKSIIRKATEEDDNIYIENKNKEKDAFIKCKERIAEHNLPMKLLDCEFTFDSAKVLFYFSAENCIDFRDLVKDLASIFRIRI